MSDWSLTLAPVFGLFVNALIQILVAHSIRRVGLSIVSGALGGLAATLQIVFLARMLPIERNLAELVVAVLTYLALAFGFWTFLNLNITSLRIRLLREILNADDGVSRLELLERYSPDEFLRRRLERLEHGKQLSYVDGRWRLISRVYLYLAKIIAFARAIVMPRQREG